MKKKCKSIDITDAQTVRPWVEDCIRRHKKRHDFRKLILRHGVTEEDYWKAVDEHNFSLIEPAVDRIAEDAVRQIKARKLELEPVRIREQEDKTTGKIRMIGCECAMQQVFDYIAVYSCQEIWDARITIQQCSSIPERGQIYGMKLIRKYVLADERAMRYAKKHKKKYVRKCAYHAKLDVRKCFPNAKKEIFMELFRHDCGNEDILWLWQTLMDTHEVNGYHGFMIGALVSQWAAQYMLSFLYHKAMTIRHRDKKAVGRMVMFMDDMLLMGSNRKALLFAVRELMAYAKALGFEIKENFMIHRLRDVPIDMMGFTIYENGKVELRGRNYIKSRRLMLRYERNGSLTVEQCKRLVSFKGFYTYSDYSGNYKIFKYAQSRLSKGGTKDGESGVFGTAGADPVPVAGGRIGGSVAPEGHPTGAQNGRGAGMGHLGGRRSDDGDALDAGRGDGAV